MTKALLRQIRFRATSPFLLAAIGMGLGAPCAAQGIGRVPGFAGVTLEYERISTGDPTLVFVHGWMCDRTYWQKQ